MAETKEEVLERVRAGLAKRPNLATGVLHQMALQIDPAIGARGARTFHAL